MCMVLEFHGEIRKKSLKKSLQVDNNEKIEKY